MIYEDVTDDYYAYFRPSIYVYPDYPLNEHEVFVVFTFENNKKSYKYKAYNLNDPRLQVEEGKWNQITFEYLSPELLDSRDKIKFYIWNKDQQNLYIDQMQIESFTRKRP